MRFIRGNSLKEAIKQFHAADKPGREASERSLAFRQLLRHFVDICNAVAYAHSRGVLHRDLKPGNVMLGQFGETLVMDWGLAKAGFTGEPQTTTTAPEEAVLRPASGSDRHATKVGAALGTVPYMSPEQAGGRIQDLTPTSDIYSLGATFYGLLTGKRAFPGKDDAEMLVKVLSGQFPPPSAVKAGVPPALEAICRKAMAYAPADRYQTALALAAEIEHWLADEPVAAFPEPWTVRLGRVARRHRAAVAGVAAFLIAAVLGLSLTTALVWTEQQKTAEQKEIAEVNFLLAQQAKQKADEQKEARPAELPAGA